METRFGNRDKTKVSRINKLDKSSRYFPSPSVRAGGILFSKRFRPSVPVCSREFYRVHANTPRTLENTRGGDAEGWFLKRLGRTRFDGTTLIEMFFVFHSGGILGAVRECIDGNGISSGARITIAVIRALTHSWKGCKKHIYIKKKKVIFFL